MIGRRVGPYRIVERLGKGGMGEVYRAVDERLDRSVALKFLAAELTHDPEAKARFLLEARAASRIDHANLCTVYEAAETEEGEAYLAMAFYEGETLRERLERGPLTFGEARDLGIQLARGLERAHEAGIVHRDVKPGNVMVTPRGEVKLLDFGLARLRDAAHLTRTGTTLGTPAYMAPEQVRGGEVGPPADVWSLGVVLYQMLAGRRPFAGDSRAVPAMILHEEPTPLAEVCPTLPTELTAIVERAMRKAPEERYPSAGEMRADLEAIRPAEVDSERTTAAATPVLTKRPWRSGRLAAALVAFVALVAAAWWLFGRDTPAPDSAAPSTAATATSSIAVFPFAVRGDPEWGYLGEGMVDLLATKLDGAGELRAADPHAVLATVRQRGAGRIGPAAAGEAAESLGAGLFVLGDVVEAGGRLHVTASLYGTAATEPLARASVEGDGAELFQLIDDLTTELLAERTATPDARVARTAALTSESLPALKSYLQGESLFRVGRFGEALEAFQAAVAEDPEFALAWYRVSVGAEWATRPDLIGPAADRALELADRLSERDRRLLEARVVSRSGDVEAAERLYRSLVRTYPDEMEAWSQLGEVLSHYRFQTGRSLTASREAWERVLVLDPENVSALWHLARVVAAEGKNGELDQIMQRLLPITPESERRLEMRALWAYSSGATAAVEADLLRELADSEDRVVWLAAWNVVLATDELAGCARILELMTDPSRPAVTRSWAEAALASLALARGRPGEARRRLREARRDSPALGLEFSIPLLAAPGAMFAEDELITLHGELEGWAAGETPPAESGSAFAGSHDGWHEAMRLFGLGIVEAALGDERALERAAELDALGERFPSDLGRTVRGYRALLRGEAATAVAELDRLDLRHPVYNYNDAIASPYFSATLPRYLHARALVEAGRLETALPILRTFGETGFADRAFEPAALVLAGEALAGLDRPDEAAAAFRRALRLWSDAEPEMEPWLRRARTGLAALAS